MAKQTGILHIEGSIDGLTFYKRGNKYLVRKKAGVEKGRIAKDPSFRRTRENCVEFGRAARAGKLLRTSLRGLVLSASDPTLTVRLSKLMLRVIKADPANFHGDRTVTDGDLGLLAGFECNDNCQFGKTFAAYVTGGIDRASGKLSLSSDPFVPARDLLVSSGATHFRLVILGVEADFENGSYESQTDSTSELPINDTPVTIDLNISLKPKSRLPLFLFAGVQFLHQVNNKFYRLSETFNPLSILRLSAFRPQPENLPTSRQACLPGGRSRNK